MPGDADSLSAVTAPDRSGDAPIDAEGPALALMTDFRERAPHLVRDTVQIDDALERMRDAGVRLLFVIDAASRLIGIVTSYDIQGERPMRYLQSLDCSLHTCRRSDVQVRHIMEPLSELRVVDLEDVRHARVADLESAFQAEGRMHLPVVERLAEGRMRIRGLFSATELERRLGRNIGVVARAQNFAEIERAMAGSTPL